jgi:hypothetical protein
MTIELPMSQQELADWVDARPESVARTLNSWRERGIIRTARRCVTVVEALSLEKIYSPAGPSRSAASQLGGIPRGSVSRLSLNCSILLTDVAGFGAPCRDDVDRRVVRDVLYRILREALEGSNVPWSMCYHEDRGDGALIIIPPAMPTDSVVDPMLALLAAKLRRHNRQASDAVRIQLRAALHVGPVLPDPEGLSGESLIYTARMLDAPVLRSGLSETRADLAFMASAFVYDTVIRHAPGLVDPATYRRVHFQVKKSKITAWMHLSGVTSDPASRRPQLACGAPELAHGR